MKQEALIIVSSSYLMIALMLSLQVYIGMRTLLFGIVLPAEALQDADVRAIRRNYVFLTGGFTIVIGGASFLWLRQQPALGLLCWMIAVLLLFIASTFAVWISRMSAQRLKAARGWQVIVQTKRSASLVVGRTHGSALSTWWYLAHVVVLALCIFFAITRWDTIPQWFHLGKYDFDKSVWTVFMLNTLQTLNIVLYTGIHLMISRARTSLDHHDPEGSLQKQLKRKKIYSLLTYYASFLIVVFLGLTQAITLYSWNENLLFRIGSPIFAALFLALIGVMLYLRFRGLDQQRDVPSQEERHWKWLGSIYVNPEDPALIVPDRYGFGWTVNMANRPGKIIVAAIIAILVNAAILGFVYFR
ncbi:MULTISPECIES: DUF5808 domain-containing protein [Paenibacillus]|uniref:DUF5808 domain-containing protein n=1 Tax=Paenibacillus borealis TaxID=160799 RepID=A0ABX3GUJ7_PAEBO|nr:DUF5808 domain-containing protein [Paenibacillus borealis]OMD36230.1 hypothetical protein BSK56_32335 [Paenibacillus borealis]